MTKRSENPKATEPLSDVAMMKIEGELTIYSAGEVANEIRSNLIEPLALAKDIEIDLSQVSEMDSAGLQILLMSKLTANRHGAQLKFVNASQPVQEVLSLSNTHSFLEVATL